MFCVIVQEKNPNEHAICGLIRTTFFLMTMLDLIFLKQLLVKSREYIFTDQFLFCDAFKPTHQKHKGKKVPRYQKRDNDLKTRGLQ